MISLLYFYPFVISDVGGTKPNCALHNYPFSIRQSGKITKNETFEYKSLPSFDCVWLLNEYHNHTTGYKKIYDEYDNYQNIIKHRRDGDIDTEVQYDSDRNLLPILTVLNPKPSGSNINDKKLERRAFVEYDERWSLPKISAKEIGFENFTNTPSLDAEKWFTQKYQYDNLGRLTNHSIEGENEEFNTYRIPIQGIECSDDEHPYSIRSVNSKGISTKSYLDGLSRPIQRVVYNYTGVPLITPISYDITGNVVQEELPFSKVNYEKGLLEANWKLLYQKPFYQNGIFNTPESISQTSSFTDTDDLTELYTSVEYEGSPLNRIKSKNLPEDWDIVEYKYETNTSSDVQKWNGLSVNGYYPAGSFYKETVIDETGMHHIKFTNFLGQLVLYRKSDGGSNEADTYYQYNNFGNLTHVIQPAGVENPTSAADFAFIYTYDGFQRMTKKKVPGKVAEEFEYDDLDRVTRHFNGMTNIYIRYDELSRPIMTSLKGMDDLTDFSDPAVLTENIYDHFSNSDFFGEETDTALPCNTIFPDDGSNAITFKDKIIATRSRVLKPEDGNHDDDLNDYVFTIYNYDNEGKQTHECSTNFLIESYTLKEKTYGLLDYVSSESISVKYPNLSPVTTTKYYSVDNAGRISDISIVSPVINSTGGAIVNVTSNITTNTYDELGRMASKDVGSIHKNEYKYNLKNWVTNINSMDQSCDYALVKLAEPADDKTTLEPDEWVDKCWEESKVSLLNLYTISSPYFSSEEEQAHYAELVYYLYNEDYHNGDSPNYTLNAEQQAHLADLQAILQAPDQTYIVRDELLENVYPVNEVLPLLQELSTDNQKTLNRSIWSKDKQNELGDLINEIDEQQLYDNYQDSYYSFSNYLETYCEAISEFSREAKPTLTQPGQKTAGESIQDNNGVHLTPDANGDYAPLFSLEATYSPSTGRMTNVAWKSAMDCVERRYNLTYDWLNRLRTADYNYTMGDYPSTEVESTGADWYYVRGNYDVAIEYNDLNGNIKTVKRKGLLPQEYTIGNDLNNNFSTETSIDDFNVDLIDDLEYHYQGNRLIKLDDYSDDYPNSLQSNKPERIDFSDGNISPNSDEYWYDSNGNMTRDRNRGISVKYNILSLPEQISRGGNDIFIYYDAHGNKLRKLSCTSQNSLTPTGPVRPVKGGSTVFTYGDPDYPPFVTTTNTSGGGIFYPVSVTRTCYKKDYLGAYEYVNGALEAINHEDGRLVYDLESIDTNTNPATLVSCDFVVKDHLGNGRMFLSKPIDETGILNPPYVVLQQEKHYYPFGLTMSGISPTFTTPRNNYQYNGKEHHNDFSLGWNDYGARWYDPQVGRWWSVDPLAGHPSQVDKSSYSYGWNNPMLYFDSTGLIPQDSNGTSNTTTFTGTYSGAEVVVRASGRWTSEANQYTWAGPYSGYQLLNPEFENIPASEAHSYWMANHSAGFFNEWDESVKIERERVAVLKMAWFTLNTSILAEYGLAVVYGPQTSGVSQGGFGLLKKVMRKISNRIELYNATRLTLKESDIYLLDDIVIDYSVAKPILLRAPAGGVKIGSKFYKGGQFIPPPRTYFGRGYSNNYFRHLPALSSSMRPTPINFEAPRYLRRSIGLGGTGLTSWYYYHKNLNR